MAARALSDLMTEWNVQGAEVVRADAFSFLRGGPVPAVAGMQPRPFDIVFLDPPFAGHLHATAASLLEQRSWLAPQALVYMECSAHETPVLPETWKSLKSKQAGEVGYHLFARAARGAAAE